MPISPVMRSLLLFMIVALKYLSPHKNLMVLKNTLSFGVQSTDLELGIRTPLFGKRCPFPQSSCVITTLVCGISLFVISTPRNPRTSKKHSNRQANGGGQVFHTESLGRIIWDGQGGMETGWSSGNPAHRSIGHSVRFYSTPFVFLSDAFSGEFLCGGDVGRTHQSICVPMV